MRFRAILSLSHITAYLVVFVTAASTSAQTWEELQTAFREPPSSARPHAFWYWMNGNVSREGITRDLEAMRDVGLGGVMIFDGGVFIPRGPVDYLSPDWLERFKFATEEAHRLGLEVALHNAPGWSSSGGPWITPELSMKQLVWSEITVTGPRRLETDLPQPFTKEGYYRDEVVLAFPAVRGEETPLDELLANATAGDGESVDFKRLGDGDFATGVDVGPRRPLVWEFREPFEARAVTVYLAPGRNAPDVALEVSDDGESYRRVAEISMSPPRGIDFPGSGNFDAVRGRWFRLVPERPCRLGEVALNAAPRIVDWNYKGHFAFRLPRATEKPESAGDQFAIDPATVRDISEQIDDAGRLTWDVPAGSWTIVRFGETSTGQQNVSAPDAGRGLECDKMSRPATEHHFQHVIGRVLAKLDGPAREAFRGVVIDSYEVEMQNWTPGFPREFDRRNGYDLRPYLPAMTGRIVGCGAASDRFLFDLRRTQADLMAENYYGRLNVLCRQHGLTLYVEPYGPGPYDELQAAGRVDVPMTEFWARNPWGENRVVKSVASAAHIYGKPVVAAEAFTSEAVTGRWLEHPYALKPVGDLMFSLGLNKTCFHRFVHQPNVHAAPGMTMGPWGFHFDRTNTWFARCGPWLDYLARCQFLLRQGNPVADVLVFVGERTPEGAQYTQPSLAAGYSYDLVNAEVLLERVRIEDGRIVLPEGTSYRLLVIPNDVWGMTPRLGARLAELVADGMPLLGPRPEFSLTLRGAGDERFHRSVAQVWDAGAGRVFSGRSIGEVLGELGVGPDFTFSGDNGDARVVWNHRRVPDGDIYFVANRQRRSEQVVGAFRVGGRRPAIWDPETGDERQYAIYHVDGERVYVPLWLEPAQSVFVVFRDQTAADAPRWLTKDGERIVQAVPYSTAASDAARLENTFTVSVWVKPDIDLRAMPRESARQAIPERGQHYVIPAAMGDEHFGAGHAAMGLAAGRNGVFVVERTGRRAVAPLVAVLPLAAWTHLAVVYRDGRPSLYVDGEHVRDGVASGLAVHPSVGVAPRDRVVYYFEGDQTQPDVFPTALDGEQIRRLAEPGLPPPELPQPAEIWVDDGGETVGLFWEAGDYQLDGSEPIEVTVAEPATVAGPWDVSFPPDRGAPERVTLDELVSLHEHGDPGVRHFSGTATYRCPFNVQAATLGDNRRVVLDLGRVEVIAEVAVNGRELGILWKPPYRVDVTAAVRAGANQLEIRVTNLWPNRLIGDESLPAVDRFRARAIDRLPEWYVGGEPPPAGGRTTFTTWQFFAADEPLLASGLLGPVRLLFPQRQIVAR